MREYGFRLSEHDAERPWLVVDQRHETVQLADDEEFFEWAARTYPRARFTVTLDPWALGTDG